MNKQKVSGLAARRAWLAAGLVLAASAAWANHITVTNVTLMYTDTNAGTTDVRFDLSWNNSWRASWTETDTGGHGDVTVTNWDAAWVFIKYRVTSGIADTNWNHAWLASGGHTAPAGSIIDLGANGGATNVGAFIYRSTNGVGTFNLNKVRLRWNYAAATNGLTKASPIDVSVHAVEMVYNPQGSFYVGSGGETNKEFGSFTDGSWINGQANTIPFRITNEAALLITNAAGYLWGTSTNGDTTIGSIGILSNAFPKGYASFYCMKYEITQSQYRDFLNELTRAQQKTRVASAGTNASYFAMSGSSTLIYRNGIRCPATVPAGPITFGCDFNNNGIFDEVSDGQDLACSYLSRGDVAAYAAWAGLRPMTELEFEKACRGPKAPVANEYAWGTITGGTITNYAGTDGSGTETAMPTNAVCNQGDVTINGPVRVGIFATAGSTRPQAGAGYYGVMELSGDMWERSVTVGAADGRTFTGTHGDGVLDTNGNATVSSWPTTGAGNRGGSYIDSAYALYISARQAAAVNDSGRYRYFGGRAVRTAP